MKIFFISLVSILLFLLFLCLYFWPYFIAIKKQKDEHLAIFVVCLIFPLVPIIGWIAVLMWAISLPDYRSSKEKEQQKDARNALWDFIVKNWIAALTISIVISLFIAFGYNSYSNDSSVVKSNKTSKNVKQNPYQNENLAEEIDEEGTIGDETYETYTYKGIDIIYNPQISSENEVRKTAKQCFETGNNSNESLNHCVGLKLDWF